MDYLSLFVCLFILLGMEKGLNHICSIHWLLFSSFSSNYHPLPCFRTVNQCSLSLWEGGLTGSQVTSIDLEAAGQSSHTGTTTYQLCEPFPVSLSVTVFPSIKWG